MTTPAAPISAAWPIELCRSTWKKKPDNDKTQYKIEKVEIPPPKKKKKKLLSVDFRLWSITEVNDASILVFLLFLTSKTVWENTPEQVEKVK